MTREETSGGSCGVAVHPGARTALCGRGGRCAIRSPRCATASIAPGSPPSEADVHKLRDSVAPPDGGTLTERQQRFEAKASGIRGAARGIAARSNELGATTAAGMRALATTVSIAPSQPGFSCHDPVLAQRLLQAADQAAQKAEPRLREAAFSEGPAGVANAVRTLWSNIGDYAKSIGRFIASGGREDLRRTASGEPITGRDVIALLATLGVDLGILALAALNPPRPARCGATRWPPTRRGYTCRPPPWSSISSARSRPRSRARRATTLISNGCGGISSTTMDRRIS